MNIRDMAEAVHTLAKSKGWHDDDETQDHFVERTCNNLHDEISELHEAWRNGNLNDPCDKAAKMVEHGIPALTCLQEELADIVIRAMDSAEKLGVDIEAVILAKHAFNKTRSHRHGGKKS